MNTITLETEKIAQDYSLTELSEIYKFGATNIPENIAVKEGKHELTFFQLENGANILANRMISLGIKNQDRIVVISEKRIEIAIIAAAIWKVGGVYVPIDGDVPEDRIQHILGNLTPKLICCSNKWSDRHQEVFNGIANILFDQMVNYQDQKETALVHKVVNQEKDTAYIIFTSGSTGIPKGVMISHRNLLDYFINHNEVFGFTKNSYCFSISPFHFDVSIEDVFLPLSRGSSVYLYKGLPIASKILKILQTEKITHAIMVSTILTLLTKLHEKIKTSDLSSLELLMTGAEVCNIDVINFWKSTLPNLRVFNAYGPTETTIVTHCYEIEKVDTNRKEIYPIGKPLRGVKSILLDENENIITANNSKGELAIGGSQVMLGYWGKPEETQKVFLEKNGEVYYRSGDFCFRDDTDDFHFVGRSDTEVKLYGRRVNLAEIHKELMRVPEVDTVVVGVLNRGDDKLIITTLVANVAISVQRLAAIDAQLKGTLPRYMLPSYIGVTMANHMSSTGKNDSKKLHLLLEKAILSEQQYYKYFKLQNDTFTGIKL